MSLSIEELSRVISHLQFVAETQEELQEHLAALSVDQLAGICRRFNCGIGELEAVLTRSWHLVSQEEYEYQRSVEEMDEV